MKLEIPREALLNQLATVSRVASTRSAVQALSGVQLQATQAGAELRATDMEVGLRGPVSTAEVSRDGTVVLPARLVIMVIRALPTDRFTPAYGPSEQDVDIVSGSATFHI